MGSLIVQGACCCFSCCCKDISDAFKRLLGPQRVTKLFYFFLVLVFTIPAIIIFFYLNQWSAFTSYFSWMQCPSSSGGGLECIGPSAVYRISLSFLALFLLMFIVTLCRNRLAMVINQGLFCVKYIFVLALFVGFLFVDNQIFLNYSDASKYLSIIFMILQAIILIDLFYMAGIKLVNQYDEGKTYCAGVLIFLSFVFELVAITFNVLGYIYFGSEDVCGDTLWVNIVNSIVIILLPCTQFLNFNKQNSLLTTSLVSVYVSYLSFFAQFSFGNNECVGRMTTVSLSADIGVSTFFFILTMYGSIMGGSGKVQVAEGVDINNALAGNQNNAEESIKNAKQLETNKAMNKEVLLDSEQKNLKEYNQSWGWPQWHFNMCFASIYVGMLITNWTSSSIITDNLVSNDIGFWVRIALSWATAVLYVWTLVAPKIFPNRDFTVV